MNLKKTVLAPIVVGDAGMIVAMASNVLTALEAAAFITAVNTLGMTFQLYLWSEAE